MNIKWLNEKEKNKIFISNKMLSKYKIKTNKITLHYGIKKKEVFIQKKNDLPSNTIGIPELIFNDISISDENIISKAIIGKKGIYIGPLIGILVPYTKNLNKYKKYFMNYKKIQGFIFIFMLKDINTSSKTIRGNYLYTKDKKSYWKTGKFPYPYVIYRRSFIKNLPQDIVKRKDVIIFNSSINKWNLWEWLSSNSELYEHLPHTKKLESAIDLEETIRQYGSVYLKQIYSRRSIGLFKVTKSEKGYHFIDRDMNEVLVKESCISEFVKNLIKNKQYIIQQAVPKKYKGRNIDFRVIMQKKQTEKWFCSGIITRFGAKGSVTTNFSDRGYLKLGRETLLKNFRLNKDEAVLKEREIIKICSKAANVLDQYGNFGDLGFDIVIDNNMKIWILEINKCHQNSLPLCLANNRKMYEKVVCNPIEYAKFLAGFK